MSDTQWKRYMVFHQNKKDAPHQHFGTVHGTDAEIALQNARDVFVRRPHCINIWVVPVEQILTKTAQQLLTEAKGFKNTDDDDSNPIQSYHVFQKLIQAGMVNRVGQVQATSHEGAMGQALKAFANEKALWWWVFPEDAVYRSKDEDLASMFEPAWDKTAFRDQGNFLTVAELRKIRAQNRKKGDKS
jgi:phenylacetate-CoA oxygenase PaaH subunit